MTPNHMRSKLVASRENSTELADLAANLRNQRRRIAIYAVEVRAASDDQRVAAVHRVTDIVTSMGAAVTAILSTTIVFAFGMIPVRDYKQVVKRLPKRFREEFSDQHRAIHTNQEVWCDYLRVDPPEMGFVWPNLLRMLEELQSSSWGSMISFRTGIEPCNEVA